MVDKIVETGTRWIQPHRKVIGYCRLSTNGQKDDLKTIWSQIRIRFLSRSSQISVRILTGWPIAADLRRMPDTVF